MKLLVDEYLSPELTRMDLHADLICLNGPPDMDLQMQLDLFNAILDEIETNDDLVNKVLEATLAARDSEVIEVRRYRLPEQD